MSSESISVKPLVNEQIRPNETKTILNSSNQKAASTGHDKRDELSILLKLRFGFFLTISI
jgi:hypothetical protein